jgi:hypothetical protein
MPTPIKTIGSTAGSGEINAITTGSTDATGWTGGTTDTSNSPLSPVTTTSIAIANSATSESSTSGGYKTFTLPTGLQNKKLKVEFYFTTPATDVYRVSVYKSTTRVPLSTDSSSVTTLPASTTGGKFTAYFDTDSSTNWTLSVTRTSGSTGACVITNVIVGPGIQPQGAVVEETFSWTPATSGLGTPTISRAVWTRRGTKMRIEARITAGTVTASSVTITLPTGTSLLPIAIDSVVGTGARQTTSPNPITVIQRSTDNAALYFGTNLSSTIGTVLLANSEPFSFTAEVDIAEWAGSGTVNLAQNDVEYLWNSDTSDADTTGSGFSYGPGGVAFGAFGAGNTGNRIKRVRSQTPNQVGDDYDIQILIQGQWVSVSDCPLNTQIHTTQLTRNYGVAVIPVTGSATDLDVYFGRGGRLTNASSYGGADASSYDVSQKWRVRKSSAGAAVGFGKATSVSTGLVAPRKGQYSLTVTGTNWTTVRAVGIYYQDQDGIPRFKFNIIGTLSSTATAFTGTITGVTFKAGSNLFQAISASVQQDGTGIRTVIGSYVSPSVGTFYVGSDAAMNRIMVSGDVELESVPTWA